MWSEMLVLVRRRSDVAYALLLFTQEYKWVPVRLEVDIVVEKASDALLRKGLRIDIGPMIRDNNVKAFSILWQIQLLLLLQININGLTFRT